MRGAILSLVLCACTHAAAEESRCGPAPSAWVEQQNASCFISDGGVFTLADGELAPVLMACTAPDGAIVESWCAPVK